MAWVPTIPLVKNGVTPLSEEGLNGIISALASRTQYLYERNDAVTSKNNIICTDTGFSSSCKRGMLIAYDSGTGRYVPASAVWSATPASDGDMTPANTAYVIGLLLTDVNVDTSASILIYGQLADPAIVSIIAASGVTGIYYLGLNGDAVTAEDRPALAVPVFQLLPSGTILFNPQQPNVGEHMHSRLVLKPNLWLPASNSGFDTYTKPPTALYGYNIAADAEASMLFLSCRESYSLTCDGLAVTPSASIIQDGVLWLLEEPPMPGFKFIFYGIAPYLGNDPYIHAVNTAPNNELLDISTVHGSVSINLNDNAKTVKPSGMCVSSISQTSGVETTPVVNRLIAGAGIKIKNYLSNGTEVPGTYSINTTSALNTLIDCAIINANGVLIGGDKAGVYTKFPKGRISSVTGTLRIPADSIDVLNGMFAMWIKGSTVGLSSLKLDLTIQEPPTESANTSAASSKTYQLIAAAPSNDPSTLYLARTKNKIAFKPNALVIATITADLTDASDDLNLLCYGVQLEG